MSCAFQLGLLLAFCNSVYGTDYYFLEGSTGILYCFKAKGKITWAFPTESSVVSDGNQINTKHPNYMRYSISGNETGEFNLQISKIQQNDVGEYQCSGQRGTNVVSEKHTLHLKVKLNSVNIEPSGPVSLQSLTTKLFECSANSLPLPVIVWYIDLNQINETFNETSNETVTSILEYTGVKYDDGKTVYCNATSDGDRARSQDAVLNITYGPESSLSLHPPNSSIVKIKGERLGPIICSADCNPTCKYQWTKGSDAVGIGNTLSIPYLEKRDNGTYTCRAWNGIGGNNIDVMLTVYYGPESANLSPDNTIYYVKEMTPLPVITCSADCNPGCTKYWFIPNSHVIQSDTLNIDNILRTQAGNYICYVNNTVTWSTSQNFTVVVSYGATVSSLAIDNEYSTVNESQNVNMTCLVDGVPQPKIVWTLDGDIIPNQENKTNHIFTANCENTGNYTCAASNYLAEGNLTKEMFVQCYPRIHRDKSTEQKVGLENDEGLNITVTLIAFPVPDINWSFQNNSISSNNSFGTFQHVSHLYKPVVEKDDFGTYSLSTSNKIGNAQYDITVGAQRSPDPPIIESAQCTQRTMKVFWNYSFDGGEAQYFSVEATHTATKEITFTEYKEYLGANPLSTIVEKLRPGVLYDVVVIAKNTHGITRSDGIANCTTKTHESSSSNIIALGAGTGTGSSLIILAVVILVILRRRSKKSHNDKEPCQSYPKEEDDSDGLKNNPLYISSGSDFLTIDSTMTNSTDKCSHGLKRDKKEKNQDNTSKSKQRKRNQKGKEIKAMELGCVYENADDFAKQGEQMHGNENGRKSITSEYRRKKNKDGLIYADLDFAPLSAERKFVVRGLENKSTYAVIDLSQKADPMPSDEEDDKTEINKKE